MAAPFLFLGLHAEALRTSFAHHFAELSWTRGCYIALLINFILSIVAFLLRRYVLVPWQRITRDVEHAAGELKRALDERILRRAVSDELRYELDDVCESSLNLRLIASALELCQQAPAPRSQRVADTMQQMLLALTPSLERRNMRLTTAGADLCAEARTDPAILSHVLWMVLLGIIRYAEAESTLQLRCGHDRRHVVVSITVSELAPGALSAAERGEYLERQMQHLNPHLFAEAIRLHANTTLAQLLLSMVGGNIAIVPLNAYACEVRLRLPAA